VTTPLFLLSAGALATTAPGADLRLDGDEGRHAASVRRIRVGEAVDVADGSGRTARCSVVRVGRDELTLRVDAMSTLAPRRPRLVLVQALAKGGRDEAAVETATELGVDLVLPWQAARSVVRWSPEREERSRQRWVAVTRAAAKQSRRATVPDVGALVTTGALGSVVAAAVAAGGAALVLHEQADEPLATIALPAGGVSAGGASDGEASDGEASDGEASDGEASDGDVLVVVGPEGGISPEEVATLVAAGARAVRLGPEVVRTSSAGPVALAVLSVRLGRW
jgi:16S rRNA (uracil1498-N3)-methyltransferase